MLNKFLTKNFIPASSKTSIKMKMVVDDEMALSEHIEEFSQRLIFCISLLVAITLFCFADVKEIVRVFQAPAIGVKFLQFAPGEYFFASVGLKNGNLVELGSRTLAAVGVGNTISEAEKIAEQKIKTVEGPLFHRKDIGTKKVIEKRIRHMNELR